MLCWVSRSAPSLHWNSAGKLTVLPEIPHSSALNGNTRAWEHVFFFACAGAAAKKGRSCRALGEPRTEMRHVYRSTTQVQENKVNTTTPNDSRSCCQLLSQPLINQTTAVIYLYGFAKRRAASQTERTLERSQGFICVSSKLRNDLKSRTTILDPSRVRAGVFGEKIHLQSNKTVFSLDSKISQNPVASRCISSNKVLQAFHEPLWETSGWRYPRLVELKACLFLIFISHVRRWWSKPDDEEQRLCTDHNPMHPSHWFLVSSRRLQV